MDSTMMRGPLNYRRPTTDGLRIIGQSQSTPPKFPLRARPLWRPLHWFVYVIQSEQDGSFYTGHTHDPALRLERHNDGWTRSTMEKRPWKIVYVETFSSKGDAMKRERQIKSMKSRAYIERLIASAGGRPDPDSIRRQ